jgi:HSP20 family protein
MSTTVIDRLLSQQGILDMEEGEDASISIVRPRVSEESPWDASTHEGELAVDIFQTENDIVIVAVIGGVGGGDIAVAIHHDVVTIRGTRHNKDQVPYDRYLTQECYWGPFSRTVMLPAEVQAEAATARFHQGVLRITLPKTARLQSTTVDIIDEGEE